MSEEPLLSVCIPTFQRPDLLDRALRSVIDRAPAPSAIVELVVSDNSTDDRSAAVCRRLLPLWDGPSRYVLNRPGIGAEPNFNRCIELSSGSWVQILHDDDHLVAGVAPVVDAVASARPDDEVLLLGVRVVDGAGRVRKRQTVRAEERLGPAAALSRVLSDSSWVRFPALIARRRAYDAVGPFDVEVRNPTDLDMWIRLFSRYGVRRVPGVAVAYTVHPGALTEAMFAPATIDVLDEVFDRVVRSGVLPETQVRHHQADFLHQFILGGTWRRVQVRDLRGARQVMRLFEHPVVREIGPSRRWGPVRAAFGAALGSPRADHQPVT